VYPQRRTIRPAMKRFFGFVFLVAAIGAIGFAFMMGASEGNGFRLDTLLHLGGIWPLVGGGVCLVLAYLSLRKEPAT